MKFYQWFVPLMVALMVIVACENTKPSVITNTELTHINAANSNVNSAKANVDRSIPPSTQPVKTWLTTASNDLASAQKNLALAIKDNVTLSKSIASQNAATVKLQTQYDDLHKKYVTEFFSFRQRVLFWVIIGTLTACLVGLAIANYFTGGSLLMLTGAIATPVSNIIGGFVHMIGSAIYGLFSWVFGLFKKNPVAPVVPTPAEINVLKDVK